MNPASAHDGRTGAETSRASDEVEADRDSSPIGTVKVPEHGRVDRWRSRANRAADRYQARAQEQPLLGLPLAFAARYTARQGGLLASAVAFRIFLWLLPLALLFAGVIAGVSSGNTHSLESASKRAGITGTASSTVIKALHDSKRSWWVAVIVGAVLFLWASGTLIRNLVAVYRHAWGLPLARTPQRTIAANSLIFGGGFVVILAAAVGILRLDRLVAGGVVLATAIEAAVLFVFWLGFSRRLPSGGHDTADLLPGAVIVGVSVAVLHAVSRVYLPRRIAHASRMYGTLGIAATMLGWLLIFGQVIVCAALANSVWTEYRAERRRRDEGARATSESQ